MAEYCKSCAAKYLGIEGKVVLSKELDLCEGCGQLKRVVVRRPTPLDILLGRAK